MLSGQNKQVIKQGYLNKKGGSGFIAKWRLKFISIVREGGSVVLNVHDKRNQSIPPKHRVILQESHLEIPNDLKASKLSKANKVTESTYLMILHSTKRKFLFSAQTKNERDEWIALLSKHCGAITNEPKIKNSIEMKHVNQSKQTHGREFTEYAESTLCPDASCAFDKSVLIDDDNISTFSDDSYCTNMTGYSVARNDPSAPLHTDYSDANSLNSSFESLSFCNEPVLTHHELSHIGTQGIRFTPNKREHSPTRKRINPNLLVNQSQGKTEDWNLQYQKLLAHTPQSDESFMKKDLQIIEIVGSFQEAARYQIKLVIDELHIKKKNEENLWSFKKDGIIYEFLVNYSTASVTDISTAYYQANHELQASKFINSVGENIHSILSLIVDYKGFRVLAHADYKAEKCSLVYCIESEVPFLNKEVSNILSTKGQLLNLKPHTVMLKNDTKYTIYGSSSIQGLYNETLNLTYLTNLHTLLPVDCDGKEKPTMDHRFRPEFLKNYPSPISADSFSEWSSSFQNEKTMNDNEALNGSKYLKEHWIPAFIKKLDYLELRPVNSQEFTDAFHTSGVNMRYIGLVAQQCKLPLIKDMCVVEMISRVTKCIFQNRIRSAIIHFRSVGATNIDEEMKNYASTLFTLVLGQNEKSYKFWEEKLHDEIQTKYGYSLSFSQLTGISHPSLFLALQYHCGIIFEDDILYDFNQVVPKSKIISFIPKTKFVWSSLPDRIIKLSKKPSSVPAEEFMAYKLARYFKSLGNNSKFHRLDQSASVLINVSAFYSASGRHEESKTYAQSAVNAASSNTCLHGLAQAQLMLAMHGSSSNADVAPGIDILSMYKQGLDHIEWHCGKDHVWTLALHDRMCFIYEQSKRPIQALEFLTLSYKISVNSLGKHHPITAGYQVKCGIIMTDIKMYDEALVHLTEALHIYHSIEADQILISEVHYHIADILSEKGDMDAAINHSQRCKKIREKSFGQQDPRTVEVYIQLSRLIISPYRSNNGVVTPQIRAAYKDIINCDEKVFRYLKTLNASSTNLLKHKNSVNSMASTRSVSQLSISSTSKSFMSVKQSVTEVEEVVVMVTGPFFTSPFTKTLPLHKNLLHKLTKQIIHLKVELLELPSHKEQVRVLRQSHLHSDVCPDEARRVILRLVAVSPSVYMDGIMARVEDEDIEAVKELSVLLQLTENEVVGVQQ